MHRSRSHSSSQSGSGSSSSSHSHSHRHQHEYLHYHSSSRSEQYSIAKGLSEQYRDMRSYVVDVHPDDHGRGEPRLTSASYGIHVAPLYPDVPDELEREVTPLFHLREEVFYDNDVFEIVSKPKLTRDGRRETWRYEIRHKRTHDRPIEVLEEHLIRIPPRRYETGAVVRHDRDSRRYEILGAAFKSQEFVWEYKIRRYSGSDGGPSYAFEGQLTRSSSTDSQGHLTPPQSSRASPPRVVPSPKGSFSNLMDSIFKH
ncbi:hypothetical protein H072_8152 [Dactylellina haptotyla CBS 200.50]|uniref:Uncharacterized protein n=1 Tax=Dactylellina haptotyla (strain CBS 200.50) TaxID=1284197 RepID=S8A5R3_DACHA|nr:hypothetical protein H072_8152 [Dactylellina haptotyla CBS 200.50]